MVAEHDLEDRLLLRWIELQSEALGVATEAGEHGVVIHPTVRVVRREVADQRRLGHDHEGTAAGSDAGGSAEAGVDRMGPAHHRFTDGCAQAHDGDRGVVEFDDRRVVQRPRRMIHGMVT